VLQHRQHRQLHTTQTHNSAICVVDCRRHGQCYA
jgi:hypothetical protein